MPGHGDKSDKKERFLAALLAEPTVLLAAKRAGISQATATRWLKEPQFKQRYSEARQAALQETVSFLQQSMFAAVVVLRSLMLDDHVKPAQKIAAAKAILELGFRSVELETIEAKMNHILQAMEELKQHAQVRASA
jgi:hypothetical protein